MANDISLAKYVNILKSDRDDLPSDVYSYSYSYMVIKVNEKIKKIIDKSYEYSKLEYLEINRKFIKRGIRTLPYGATKRGISQQLKEDHFQFDKYVDKKAVYILKDDIFNKNKISFYLNNKEIYCLAHIIYDVLYDYFPSLKLLVSYLKDMNKTLKNLNLNTIWMSPGGLIIQQRYVEKKILN